MPRCEYQYYDCPRETHPNSPNNLCILHEEWENKDPEETKEAFYKEIEEGKTDFTGCILPPINLSDETIKEVNFNGATIKRYASFDGAEIEGDALFVRATIEGNALFDRARIKGDALFGGATIKGNAVFHGAEIEGDASFSPANIDNFLIENRTVFKKILQKKRLIEQRKEHRKH